MEKIVVIIALIGIFSLVIYAFVLNDNTRDRTKLLFDELTPIVHDANTLEEVSKAWDLLVEKCTEKYGKNKRALTIDTAWREDYIKLYTICETKYKLLKTLTNPKNK